MLKTVRLPALLTCAAMAGLGSAQAAAIEVLDYWVQPHRQTVLIVADAKLGYPLGDVTVGLAWDCKAGKVFIFNLGRSAMGTPSFLSPTRVQDDALTNALLDKKLITAQVGMLSINQMKTPVVSRCSNKRLDAALDTNLSTGQKKSVQLAIGSADNDDPSADPADAVRLDLTFGVTPTGKTFNLTDFETDAPELFFMHATNGQILLSDGKALYPIYYNGSAQPNHFATTLKVSEALNVYVTLDGKTWNKTLVNFKTKRIMTAPISKPNLPIRS